MEAIENVYGISSVKEESVSSTDETAASFEGKDKATEDDVPLHTTMRNILRHFSEQASSLIVWNHIVDEYWNINDY